MDPPPLNQWTMLGLGLGVVVAALSLAALLLALVDWVWERWERAHHGERE